MKAVYFFIVVFLFASYSFSQVTTPGVVLHKDGRIDDLLKKQADINKVAVIKNSAGRYKGYRVMALSTNDRNLYLKTKAELLGRFPDFQVYVSYQAPFFKVKIGDFIKRNDAEDLRKRIATLMAHDVYIVPDIVVLRPEDEERLINNN